jgi:hypothetical protein
MALRGIRMLSSVVVLAVVVTGCGAGSRQSTESAESAETGEAMVGAFPGYSSRVYADLATWLCRPDTDDDACDIDLDAERIEADGSRRLEPFEPTAEPPVDCFYVYPTVSTDPGANSDLLAGDGERLAAANQLARLASTCRLWAPLYEQVTLSGIGGLEARSDAPDVSTTTPGQAGAESGAGGASARDSTGAATDVTERTPSQTAYDGVLDAFRHYMANHNAGRGVVLVGHSQGTGHLRRLIAEEVDGNPQLRTQLVSAVLLGLSVPEDPADGGFANVPPCRSETQVGCHVSWASYRSTAPPGPGGLFGRPTDSGGRSTCTNPADLSGEAGRVPLTPYFTAERSPGGAGWLADGSAPGAPWVALPGLVEAECVERDGYHYLEITVVPDASRAPDVPGDLPGGWGLHLVDANLAMGELVNLVAAQSAAWVTAN